MGRHLQPHYAASVKTTDLTTIATPLGPVVQNVEVFVPQGGELPDNIAEGEEQRIAALGAFDPLPPLEERVVAKGVSI
jgi:hypothetical protein